MSSEVAYDPSIRSMSQPISIALKTQCIELQLKVNKVKQYQQTLALSSSIKAQDSLLSKHVIALEGQIQEELKASLSQEGLFCSCCSRIKKFIISLFPHNPVARSPYDTSMIEITRLDLYQQLILYKTMSKLLNMLEKKHISPTTELRAEILDPLFRQIYHEVPLWTRLYSYLSQVDEALFTTITDSSKRHQIFTLARSVGFPEIFPKYQFSFLLYTYEEELQKIYNEIHPSVEDFYDLSAPYEPENFLKHAEQWSQDDLISFFDGASSFFFMQFHSSFMTELVGTDLALLQEIAQKAPYRLKWQIISNFDFLETFLKSDPTLLKSLLLQDNALLERSIKLMPCILERLSKLNCGAVETTAIPNNKPLNTLLKKRKVTFCFGDTEGP